MLVQFLECLLHIYCILSLCYVYFGQHQFSYWHVADSHSVLIFSYDSKDGELNPPSRSKCLSERTSRLANYVGSYTTNFSHKTPQKGGTCQIPVLCLGEPVNLIEFKGYKKSILICFSWNQCFTASVTICTGRTLQTQWVFILTDTLWNGWFILIILLSF